jgi:hypothetical protein
VIIAISRKYFILALPMLSGIAFAIALAARPAALPRLLAASGREQ